MPKTPSYLKTDLRLRSSYPQALPPSAHPLICTNASPHHVTGEGQLGVILKGEALTSCSPGIPFLRVHHQETRAYLHTKSCTRMCMATSFKIVKKTMMKKKKIVNHQGPPGCPSAGSSNCGPSTQMTGMLLASKKE